MKRCSQMYSKKAEFFSICGPKYCLMQKKITNEVLAGLEDILKAKGGAVELVGVKHLKQS